MRSVTKSEMLQNVKLHPYESSPGFIGKINAFYTSSDNKCVIGYWEAPVGWFEVDMGEQSEVNYIMEGTIEIENIELKRKIYASAGDCFFAEKGEKLKWIITKPIRTFFSIYPASGDTIAFFRKLKDEG